MARDFSKVSPSLWSSQRFRSISERGRMAYLHALTSAHGNSAGCYRLPAAYAADDLGWTPDEYSEARDEAVRADLLAHDAATSEILILRWFKHNPINGPKNSTGTRRIVAEISSDRLREIAEAAFTEADAEREARESAAKAEREARKEAAAKTAQLAARSIGDLSRTAFMQRGRAA